jgi:hypothetical protein
MGRHDDDGWTTNPDYAALRNIKEDEGRDYEVGYAKPPVHTRFKRGTSGNLKGRPKIPPSANSIIRKILNRKRRISVGGEVVEVTNQEALYLSAFARAVNGDPQSTKMFHTAVTEEERANRPFKTNELKVVLVGVDGQEKPLGGEKNKK